jgi:hypothetical protein
MAFARRARRVNAAVRRLPRDHALGVRLVVVRVVSPLRRTGAASGVMQRAKGESGSVGRAARRGRDASVANPRGQRRWAAMSARPIVIHHQINHTFMPQSSMTTPMGWPWLCLPKWITLVFLRLLTVEYVRVVMCLEQDGPQNPNPPVDLRSAPRPNVPLCRGLVLRLRFRETAAICADRHGLTGD